MSNSQQNPFCIEIPGLFQRHFDELTKGSGISVEVIRERGYKTILGSAELQQLGFAKFQRRTPGLYLPLWTVEGKNTLCQYKPDVPRQNKKGKDIKYETPDDVGLRLDVPPRCRENLKNPNIRLWITEGIKKADALASHGECIIDLLGVWSFKGKNEFGGITFLADWDYIALNERLVYIIFDSDVMMKPQVNQALDRLTEHLSRKAAQVFHIYLPSPDGKKVGVDDFLVQGHTIDDLITLAREPRISGNGSHKSREHSFDPESEDGSPDEDYGVTDKDILPQTAFPLDIFPPKLKSVIARISDALQVKPEVVAGIMLCIISGAVGNTMRVSPKLGYEVAPFLWLIIIAHSGYGKSPALNALIRPVKELQAEAHKIFQEELNKYKKMLRAAKLDQSIDVPDEPKPKHFFFSDTTVEALGKGFESTPRGLIVYQDELSGLILGLNQYKSSGTGNDRQHYLELFDCQSWKIDRKSGTSFIPNTGASIVGSIQPRIMPRVFSAESFDDGLLPRFTFINTDDGPLKFSRQGINPEDIVYWENLIQRCYAMDLLLDKDGFVRPNVLTMGSQGQDCFEAFYNEYGAIMPFLSDRAKVFIPKLLIYGLKFMGVLHVLNAFCDKKVIDVIDVTVCLRKEIIDNAIVLTRYFAGQAVRMLGLYSPCGQKFNEFELTLIKSLFELKHTVVNGELLLSKLVDAFNSSLPNNLKHTPEKVSSLLRRGLGLSTTKGAGNSTYLIWEKDKIENLFSKINDNIDNNDNHNRKDYDAAPENPADLGIEAEEFLRETETL